MKNILKIALPFIALAMLFSCNVEDLEDYNPEFKGEWRSAKYYTPSVGDSTQNYITIDGRDGGLGIGCEIDCQFCKCMVFQAGRVKINKKTKEIQVGGTVQQIMRITQEPFVNFEGRWEMEIDNVAYFRDE